MPEKLSYQPRGPCAILQAALGQSFDPMPVPAMQAEPGGQAVVDVVGPLTHHVSFGMDSYDGILERVRAACATQAASVVLRIDSPGGDVAGCFETARAMRSACDAAGKGLITYISGAGCSAAFALACAADKIYASSSSCVGSIGVIDIMVSVVRKDAAMGIDTVVVTSGERKADGNPHVPLSEGALAAHQAHVDDLAGVFFQWVGERRGIAAEAVKGLNAAVFVGQRAAEVGLIDGVADFQGLQEILKGGTITATARNVPQGITMATQANSKYVDAMAALAAAAEEGDERARAAMKKMAAAAEDKDGDKDAPKPDAAAAPPGEDKKDKKDEEAKALAAKAARAAAGVPGANFDVVEAVRALQAANVQREIAAERTALLSTRPDLMADSVIKASLEKASLETIRETFKIIPKATLAAPAQVAPTQGATAGSPIGLPANESAELKARMGLTPHPTASVRKIGVDLTIFGATEEQAAQIAAERGF